MSAKDKKSFRRGFYEQKTLKKVLSEIKTPRGLLEKKKPLNILVKIINPKRALKCILGTEKQTSQYLLNTRRPSNSEF